MRILGSVLLLGSVLAVACADVDDVDPIPRLAQHATTTTIWDEQRIYRQNASGNATQTTTATRRTSTGR